MPSQLCPALPFSALLCRIWAPPPPPSFPASSIVLAFTKNDSGCIDLVLNQKVDGRRLTRFEARDDLSSLDLFVLE
ncbi:hypothetical protein SDJN03_19736, partial [Cucurbita argyrosperma subsp. sororia]